MTMPEPYGVGNSRITALAPQNDMQLIAAPDCVTAERAAIALALCDRPVRPVAGPQTGLRLASPFRKELVIQEPLAILTLLDELCPGTLFSANPVERAEQHKLTGLALLADQRLAEVIAARNPRDLDIAIHLLRDSVLLIERCFRQRSPASRLDVRDAVAAPLIWRMMMLDRHCQAHLCLGLERVTANTARILQLNGVADVLGKAAEARFLDHLPHDAAIGLPADQRIDWSPALGPAGRPQHLNDRTRRLTVVPASPTPSPGPADPAGDDPLAAVTEKLRLIRLTSQQRRYPGRATPRLPSRPAVIRLLADTIGALYPRHYGPEGMDAQAAELFITQTLQSVRQRLADQLELEWLLQPDADPAECRQRAQATAARFLAGLPQIRDLHDTDINAAFQGDPSAKSLDEIILCFPGIAAILRHRLAHSLYGFGAPMLARIMARHSHSLSGIDIHPGARIGPACFIDHGTGVVIGETAVLGRNVRIYQQVTLGAKRFESDGEGGLVKGQPRHPLVGDDVVIYAGATILGRIEIGKGATIGGGVWLTEPVPPGAVVTQARASLNTSG